VKTIFIALCAAAALATTSISSFADSTGNESNNPYVIQGLWPEPDRDTVAERRVPSQRYMEQQKASNAGSSRADAQVER
jgi:hypothetical protein